MSTITFSIFSSILGFIAATISLSSCLINICRSQLPSSRIKDLECLMDETDALFKKVTEDDHLIEPSFVQKANYRLRRLKGSTYHLQSLVYDATTLRQEYVEFLKGTSHAIGTTCQALKELKAQVIKARVISGKDRDRLMDINSLPALPPIPDLEGHPGPSLSIQVPRPRSCPPTVLGPRSSDAQNRLAQKDPLRGPTQGSLDVRTTDVQKRTSMIHTSATIEPEA